MMRPLAVLCVISWVGCGSATQSPVSDDNSGGVGGGVGRAAADLMEGGKGGKMATDAAVGNSPDVRIPATDAGTRTDVASMPDAASDGGTVASMFPSPCPAAPEACKILPLGDSITDGVGSSGGGYRVSLFSEALKTGKNITFVGSLENGPNTVSGKPFPRQHEGHSGTFIEGLQYSVANVVKTFKPHIVLLMVGTNDANRSPANELATAPARLGVLVDTILENAGAKTVVVVAKIVPTTDDGNNARVRAYNAALPQVVAKRVAAGKSVVLVDMYEAFTANVKFKQAYMNDGLHPNDAGYVVMTKTWWPAIAGMLK